MERTTWLQRKFNFDFSAGMVYVVLERLRGAIPRMRDITAGLTNEQLCYRPNSKWSIKEHIGHLSDLEDIHDGRIDDLIAGKETLRAADMTNAKTNTANHNDRSIEDLLNEFATKRNAFIARLQQLDDNIQMRQALHPRLQVMMRPVDVAYFTAEHDDDHITSIREIIVAL